MKNCTFIVALIIASLFISCSKSSVVTDCESECLGTSRQAIAACGDNQKCKMAAKETYNTCKAACNK